MSGFNSAQQREDDGQFPTAYWNKLFEGSPEPYDLGL